MILRDFLCSCLFFISIVEKNVAKVVKCGANRFQCDKNQCIPRSWVCDGSPDCRDNTDESEATCPGQSVVSKTCRDDQFLCNSGICIPQSWKCDGGRDCPDASDEDEEMCSQSTCESSEFRCSDGQCVAGKWRCNGLPDCADGSDEIDCPEDKNKQEEKEPADDNLFRCNNGFVIPNKWVCDGSNDCRDGGDEQGCLENNPSNKGPFRPSCKEHEFQCPNSFCIPRSWLCDGMRECLHGEDEVNCPPRNCTRTEFRCRDGSCVKASSRCNGLRDCTDGSDEEACTTKATVTTTTASTSTETTSSVTSSAVTDGTVKNGCDTSNGKFACNNGICISKEKVCDGTIDCSSNEDESEETCGVNECARNNGGCAHKCVDTRESYLCQCEEGYRLVGKYNCEDIDECSEVPGVCSQTCTNTIGRFHCSCLPGYIRDPANYTRCRAAQGEVFLLFSHSFDIRQLRLRDRDMTSIVEDTRSAIALDYVFSERQILWSDNKENKIYIANLTNTNDRRVLLSNEQVSADGLAVDWIHKNVYYTNSKKDAVFLLSWDGRWTKTIVQEEVRSPRAIAVSPHKGFLFWTDWGSEAKIERSGLDGSGRIAIVESEDHVKWPNGLTIDHPTERIYWCDGYLRTIFAADIDGSNVEVILHSSSVLNHPFSISVFEDRLYWTDWSRVALFSADKFTGAEVVNVSAGHLLEAPKVVHVFHEYRQPIVKNICEASECQHFCVRDSEGAALCVCADGYSLDDDRISCVDMSPPPVDSLPVAPKSDGDISREKLVHEELQLYQKEAENERNGHIGFILGGTFGAAVVIAAVIALYVVYARTSQRTVRRIRFHNPVYKNTTEAVDEDDVMGPIIRQENYPCPPLSQLAVPNNYFVDDDHVPLAPKEQIED